MMPKIQSISFLCLLFCDSEFGASRARVLRDFAFLRKDRFSVQCLQRGDDVTVEVFLLFSVDVSRFDEVLYHPVFQ